MISPQSDQTPALGAAIFGAVAAGRKLSGFAKIEDAQAVMTGVKEVYEPKEENREIYQQLFRLYSQLHDALGTRQGSGALYNVMKDLITIREKQRKLR